MWAFLSNPANDIKTLAALVGVAGLWFGVFQYRASRIWKRQEFTAAIFKELSTDPDLRLAILFLDWRRRTMKLPERFVVNDSDQRIFIHDHHGLSVAFSLASRESISGTNNLDLKPEFETAVNFMYVEVFDALFNYFERVYTFDSLGLIKRKEIDGILYWARRVSELEVEGVAVFMNYLTHYKYQGVLALNMPNNRFNPMALLPCRGGKTRPRHRGQVL